MTIKHLHSRLYIILLSCIIVLGLFLRVYNLTNDPAGFFCDEASIGYNAYSIRIREKMSMVFRFLSFLKPSENIKIRLRFTRQYLLLHFLGCMNGVLEFHQQSTERLALSQYIF